jgi:peptide/nickel transport system substrate-binding protein
MTPTRRALLMSTTAVALTAGFAGALPTDLFAQDAPKKGGIVTVHMNSEQRILNPALRASTGVYVIAAKIMEPLVDLDGEGKPVAILATSWTSTPDGKTITFKLREGVTWHDGKPFTSADVAYTAMELWKKHLNYGTTLQLYLDAVETPDAATAIFKYSRPMPLDLLLRALPDLGYIAPKHIYDGTNVLENPANTAPIGTGPFKFVQYERGQFIIAEKNPNYWNKGFPHLDRIVWRFITDKAASTAAMEAGQVQVSPYSSLPLSDLDRLKKDPRFEVTTKGNEGNGVNNTIEFNLRRKELADVRVRRAIAHALDVDFFCTNFLYGFGKRGTGPIPTSSPAFYPTGTPQYAFDKAKAEALLDEAGYKKGADGTRFSVKLSPAPWGEDIALWATFVQQSLAAVGIKVEVLRHDAPGFLTTVYKDWSFDLATGWHQYRNDPAVSTTVWYRSGSPKGTPWTNQWGWTSDAVDKTIDDAASELDPAKRKALYAQFVTQVNTELPIWMAIERQFVTVVNKTLRNHSNMPRWPSSSWADLWVAG